MANPVEEFLALKKQASDVDLGDVAAGAAGVAGGVMGGQAGAQAAQSLGKKIPAMAGHLGRAGLTGLGVAAGSIGVTAAGLGIKKLYDSITKARDFKNMLEVNPHLREFQEQDPQGFNHAFSALRALAPDFSREPLVAGAFMARAMDMTPDMRGMVAVEALRSLPSSAGRSPITEAGLSGFQKGVGIAPKPPDPRQKGTRKITYSPGEEGPVTRVEETENLY